MKKYINQLLSDISNSTRPYELNMLEVLPASEINEVEHYLEYINNETRVPFSQYCNNIDSNVFPPGEMLTHDNITSLCSGLSELYLSWNLIPDLPETLPIRDKYRFLTSILDMNITPTDKALIGIEFCDYILDECPFGEDHCNCKTWQEEIKQNLEIQVQEVLESVNEFIDNQGYEEYLFINYNGAEQLKRYRMPLKPIGECIGIDIFNLPSAYELTVVQIDTIISTFLNAWKCNDEIHVLFRDNDPIKRYETWQEFIHSLAWFDGLSEFILCPNNLKDVLNENIGDGNVIYMDDDESLDTTV